jgi:serine/threonine protein kinase
MLRDANDMDPVIVDFGLAADVTSEDYIFYRCGTPGYVAPEVISLNKGEKISPICDVFSAGAIFHILLVAKPLFTGSKFEEVYDNNRKLNFNLRSREYSQVNPEALDLLEKMLKINPK